MKTQLKLNCDPYNVVITGVGGQGTVMASRAIGNMMSELGLNVTIGETFGASQRGGSVMSHLRISSQGGCSPQIPIGQAHLVVAFEPIEALRVLKDYGNPQIKVLCNTRPIHPESVMAGDATYPSLEQIECGIAKLAATAHCIDATEQALKLGNPVFANTIMVGALASMQVLPLDIDTFKTVLSRTMTPEKVEINLQAYQLGASLVESK
jgi:indolepyruvate ferredoxin oxidoreductase beta subunit